MSLLDKLPACSFQYRLFLWMDACFGSKITFDKTERNYRFLEEALETVQSLGLTRVEAHQLVDYVFLRPDGEPEQEVGGALVCLTALCTANNFNLELCGERELARIWTKIDKIREKQKNKPRFGPLPE